MRWLVCDRVTCIRAAIDNDSLPVVSFIHPPVPLVKLRKINTNVKII